MIISGPNGPIIGSLGSEPEVCNVLMYYFIDYVTSVVDVTSYTSLLQSSLSNPALYNPAPSINQHNFQ